VTLFEEGTPPPSAPATAETQRIRLTVAYDGSRFHGFAANPGVSTVGGSLAGAIAKVVGHPVQLTCAGRTDTGVHAWGQVVHFDTDHFAVDAEAELRRLQRSLNKMLAPAVVVREASVAPPGFDARRSATGRRYRYTVLNRPLPDPFLAAVTWHVADPLDLLAMQLGCDPLFGEHDWTSFCRKPPAPDASLVRIVRDARWVDLGDGLLRFEIEASAFCHQMVRSLVGTLVTVGRARLRAGDIAGIIRAKDRALAGEPAPAEGLCLWEVTYG
jgi:tRNA pseudouridine38-40 synthase